MIRLPGLSAEYRILRKGFLIVSSKAFDICNIWSLRVLQAIPPVLEATGKVKHLGAKLALAVPDKVLLSLEF